MCMYILYVYTSKKGSNGNNIPAYHLWAILVKHDTGKRRYVCIYIYIQRKYTYIYIYIFIHIYIYVYMLFW